MIQAFAPAGPSSVLAATTSTGNVAFNGIGATNSKHCRIYNAGPDAAAVTFGGSAVVATVPAGSKTASSGVVIPAGAIEVVGCNGQTYAAAIALTSTATLYLTPGQGL